MTKWTALPTALCLILTTHALAEDDALFAAEEEPAEVAAEPAAQEAEPAEPEADAEPTTEELQAQARELNQQLQQIQTELRQLNRQQGNGNAPVGLIDTINLPEDPTRADCERFIEELAEATEGQNSFSTNDPQVQKLAQIPPEHIDLLITASTGRSPLRYHAGYAMREMDFSFLRDRIDSLLRDQPAMIGIVVSQGWANDAKQAIADKINQRPANLGLAWFQAASELNDPALYDAIHDCVLQTRNFSQVILMLEGMADYDIERTVAELWERSQQDNSSNNYQVAIVAVRFGYVDALGELISQLNRRSIYYNNNGENTYDTQRATLMRYIDYSGSIAEIAQWFEDHKGELVFDHVTQRYLLPEQLEQF
ncbi:MAG: FlxA-like family protein [Phycisphaerales bacterium JB063]